MGHPKWDEVNAMEPGLKFDQLIAEQVMKWKPHSRNTGLWVDANDINHPMASSHGSIFDFHPTKNIVDAWKVVERMRRDGNEVNLWMYEPYRGVRCMIEDANHGPQFSFKGKTAPEAICKSALLAVMP